VGGVGVGCIGERPLWCWGGGGGGGGEEVTCLEGVCVYVCGFDW